MSTEATIILINRALPYNCIGRLTGRSGTEYGQSAYEDAHGAHVCRLALSQWRACKEDVTYGMMRRWSQWEIDLEGTPAMTPNPEPAERAHRVIDPGHLYELLSLDNKGEAPQLLRFVKRFSPEDATAYPGNHNAHEGTTTQSVLRCALERMRYVDAQKPCVENKEVVGHLRECLRLLEQRAINRHGINFQISAEMAENEAMCPVCGHVVCKHRRQPTDPAPTAAESQSEAGTSEL